MRHFAIATLILDLTSLVSGSPITKRAQPGDKLEQTFTVRLMSVHCAPFKASITLNTFDEHDDSVEGHASGQTFTTLLDYQNADGTQVKPSHGLCQFGEIPFTEIPLEPRKFTVILIEEGHRQKQMDVSRVPFLSLRLNAYATLMQGSINFYEDPKRDHLDWGLGHFIDFVEEGEPEFQDSDHFELVISPDMDDIS